MFKLTLGSNNVQNDSVVLLVVLPFTPPLECKGIKILLMCKEFSDFFCVKTLWTKLLGIYSVYLNLEFGF